MTKERIPVLLLQLHSHDAELALMEAVGFLPTPRVITGQSERAPRASPTVVPWPLKQAFLRVKRRLYNNQPDGVRIGIFSHKPRRDITPVPEDLKDPSNWSTWNAWSLAPLFHVSWGPKEPLLAVTTSCQLPGTSDKAFYRGHTQFWFKFNLCGQLFV